MWEVELAEFDYFSYLQKGIYYLNIAESVGSFAHLISYLISYIVCIFVASLRFSDIHRFKRGGGVLWGWGCFVLFFNSISYIFQIPSIYSTITTFMMYA